MKYVVKLLGLLLLTGMNTKTMDKVILIKTASSAIPKYVAAATAMEIVTTITHEIGHAIPNHIFFGNVKGFSFFGTPVVKTQIGDINVTVGTNPLGKSSALLNNIAIADNDYKLLAIAANAAGPLTGLIGTCLVKKTLLKTSLNKRAINWTSRLVHANNLSSFIPVSRKDKNNPEKMVTSDGQHMINLYGAYKNNTMCDLGGNPIPSADKR